MVTRFYIKCQTCDHLYQIKLQYDTSMYVFNWPLRIDCIECNDTLKATFTKKGLIPIGYRAEEPKDHSVLTTVLGYSAALPITPDLYMQEYDATMSIINFSPYMNLSFQVFNSQEIKKFEFFCHRLNENLLPYRTSMKELFPILKKGNIKAFSKKMAMIFNLKKYKEIDTYINCKNAFHDLIIRSYKNLCTDMYNSQVVNPYVERLFNLVNQRNAEELQEIKEKLNKCTILSDWLNNEAYPYIVKMISEIQELIPAMIYADVGETDITRGNLNIVTIDHHSAIDYYADGYEVITHGLPFIVGLTNLLENGDTDKFVNTGMKGVLNLKMFSSLSGGLMEEKLVDYETINNYLLGSMERRLRNASIHKGIEYNPMTQEMECQFDIKNDDKVYNIRLIEVCHKTYIQLLHIIEIALLAYEILKKAKK